MLRNTWMAPYVTFHTYDVLPTICAMCPHKIIPRAKVPLECNFANKSDLFPQAAPCPFSILGRTLLVSIVHCAQPQTQFAHPGNKWRDRFCDSWFIVSDSKRPWAQFAYPGNKWNEYAHASCVNYAKRIAAAYLSTLKLCCDISGNTRNEYL